MKGKNIRDNFFTLVEPVSLCFMLGQHLAYPTNTSLIYKKSCLEHYNSSFCESMENRTFQKAHKDQQDVIQETASTWLNYVYVAISVPSIIVVFLFIGSWGDKVDRKVAILLPFIGSFLNNVSFLLNSFYMEWPIEYIVIGPAINGLFGNFSTALMGIYTYVAYTAKPSEKTVRIGIMEALSFLSGSIATFVSGLVLRAVGFSHVYIICLSFQGFAILYCLFLVRGIKPTTKTDEEKEMSCCSYWFFNPLKTMIAFILKKRPGRRQFYMWMYVFLINMVLLGTLGEVDILYLFLRRTPRAFNRTEYGYFRGSESFCKVLALLTLLPFMKKVLKVKDNYLLMLGLLFKGLGFVFLGVATTYATVFCVLIFATLHGFPAAAIRSGISSLVEPQEYGRVFAVIAVTESMLSLAATFIFNKLYPLTLPFFDGLLFECTAAICFLVLILTVYLHLDMEKNKEDGCEPLPDNNTCSELGLSTCDGKPDGEGACIVHTINPMSKVDMTA